MRVGPDHIEAASVAAIAALSGDHPDRRDCHVGHARRDRQDLWRLGIQLDIDEAAIFVPKHETLTVSNREEDAAAIQRRDGFIMVSVDGDRDEARHADATRSLFQNVLLRSEEMCRLSSRPAIRYRNQR